MDFEIDYEFYNNIESLISDSEQKETNKRMLFAKELSLEIKAKGWDKSYFALIMNRDISIIDRWLSGTHTFDNQTLVEIKTKLI